MSLLEIIAVLFSFTAVILIINKNVLSWPVGFIGSCVYVYVLLNQNLYACAATQFIFAMQSLKGWKDWKSAKLESDDIKIKVIDKHTFLFSMIIFFILWIGTIIVFIKYTDNKFPISDSFASLMAIMANYYLVKRFIENWIAWIISDIILIGVFALSGLYLSSFLYVIFFCLASYGYFQWKRDLNRQIDME